MLPGGGGTCTMIVGLLLTLTGADGVGVAAGGSVVALGVEKSSGRGGDRVGDGWRWLRRAGATRGETNPGCQCDDRDCDELLDMHLVLPRYSVRLHPFTHGPLSGPDNQRVNHGGNLLDMRSGQGPPTGSRAETHRRSLLFD